MKTIMTKPLSLILLATFFFSPDAFADRSSPFLTRNQNPLVSAYGLPLPTPASIIGDGQSRLIPSLNISNTINAQQSGNESLFNDIESYELNLLYDRSLNANWMLRLHLPLKAYSGGFLDAWIDNYHEFMHLPEDIRPDFPRDQLQIDYQINNSSQLDISQRQNSVGDISIQTGYQFSRQQDFSLSYWSSVKLPTGDSRKLTGSEGFDLALWMASEYRIGDSRWLYGNLGVLLMEDSELLENQHKNAVTFGHLGLQFHPWKPVLLRAQLDIHTAFYESTIDYLSEAMQLTFGGTILFEDGSSLDIAVAEDTPSGHSPDVNFNFSWRINF